MFVKIKEFFRHNRFAVSASCMMAMLMFSAFAAEGSTAATFDLTTVMTTSVTKIVNDLLAMITAVLPTAIILFSASVGVTYAIRFIKRILSKAN